MAYTTADGPPDLTATHIWTPATGSGPPTINYQGGTWPPTLPWIRLLRITGWRSLPESEDLRDPRTYIGGEITYPSKILGKTLVYEVSIQALTVQSAQTTATSLMRGFSNMSDEGYMTVTPLAIFGGGVVWTYHARVLSVELDPGWDFHQHRQAKFSWGAALTLRMSDPHFYNDGVAYF